MELKAYSYIRFSTPKQEEGDSLRRQLEASRKWAEEHGLILDESLQDLGLSAFKGIHKVKGALGKFLELVKVHRIESGSYLIVENLDRLSREEVLEALTQFTSIIHAGIIIVTLQDNMIYSKDSIKDNWAQLIISITYMARAYDESKRKSQRISSAWVIKRKNAINEGSKLTAKAPLWLTLSDDKKEFTPIPEACNTIELIFRLRLSGMGIGRIEHELNRRKDVWVPPKNKKRKTSGWRGSYITKILSSRALIGEFTPHRLTDEGRVAESPIQNYFPKVVDEELFYNVQSQIRNNAAVKGHSGGQTGKAYNLFTQVIRCGLCKAPMHYVDKGKTSKGGTYLHCDVSRRLKTCTAKAVRYKEFEQLFFENFQELNISDLLPDKNQIQIQKNDLNRKITANIQRIFVLEKQVENLTDTIGSTDDKRVRITLERRLSQSLDEKESLIQNNSIIEKELQALTSESIELQNNLDTANEVYGLLDACKNETERINLRLKLRTEIRKLVKSIEIYPLQEAYKPIEEVEPGYYITMNSRYIDKVRISFKGNTKKKRILMVKSSINIDKNPL